VMLVGETRRGSRVHGVVLAPGGRRVEVRIVIHPSHGKRPSADSGGEGGRGGRAGGGRGGDRARGRLRSREGAREGASRETRVGEPSGGACSCLSARDPPPRFSQSSSLEAQQVGASDASGASGGICDAFSRCAFRVFACIFGKPSSEKRGNESMCGSWFVIPRVGHLSGGVRHFNPQIID
jgi:hypothetical protein